MSPCKNVYIVISIMILYAIIEGGDDSNAQCAIFVFYLVPESGNVSLRNRNESKFGRHFSANLSSRVCCMYVCMYLKVLRVSFFSDANR